MNPFVKKNKGMPQIPLYDQGGDVAMSGFRKMAPSLDEEDPHLVEEQIPQYTHGGDQGRAKPQPKDFNGGSVGGAQDTALAHPAYAAGQVPAMAAPAMPIIPVHDNGGNINVHDGRHQLAILQDGERVLTPQQNQGLKKFAKENSVKGFPKIYDDGGDVPKVDDEQLNSRVAPVLEPKEPAAPTEKEQAKEHVDNPGAQVSTSQPSEQLIQERGTPQERAAIRTDKQNAMGSGDLIGLGKAVLNERHLIAPPEFNQGDPNADVENGMTAPKEFNQGATAPSMPKIKSAASSVVDPQTLALIPGTPEHREMHQDTAGGQLISGAPSTETRGEQRDLRGMERRAKMADYDQRIQSARDAGDDLTADKLAFAKSKYQQSQHFADRSLLGKIGHVASQVGNVAGDVFAPATMELIPGTDLNRRVRDAGLQRQISQDTENYARMAGANAKEGKADNYDVKEVVDNRQGSPTFGQTIYAGVNKTDPTDVRYSPLQVAPKAAGEPKAETREQHLNRYAELKNQAESGAQLSDQDQKELNTLKTELTVPKATMDSYNKQIDAALHSANVPQNLWNNYHVLPGATAEEAKQSIADAKAFSGETYQQGGEQRKINDETRKQDEKDKNALVYVETGNGVVLTNQYDLDHHEGAMKGAQVLSNAEPVKSGDVSKDKTALRQLNDVQINTSRYAKAQRDYESARLTDTQRATDTDKMQEILALQNQSGGSLLSAGTSGISLNSIPVVGAKLNKENYKQAQEDLAALTPQARAKLNGYLRTAAAVPAYQKALTGIGRSNKEMLDLELNNIPMPYYDAATSGERMTSFQENIDQASNGFPNNIPGVKHPSATREETEGRTKPSPADVVNTGTYKGKTVYQLKNGKTVYDDGKPVEVK